MSIMILATISTAQENK
ncbi:MULTISPECIES: hypothetical protein [unclassified Citrobacter]|nr:MULTISPECIES: hypothetical protein [unclassified Citrobacter]